MSEHMSTGTDTLRWEYDEYHHCWYDRDSDEAVGGNELTVILNQQAARIEELERLGPWSDGVALNGPDVPEDDGRIEHLIGYLQTVRKRFGNTAVTVELQWGGSALWKRNEQANTIAERDATIERLQSKADERAEAMNTYELLAGVSIEATLESAQRNKAIPRAVVKRTEMDD